MSTELVKQNSGLPEINGVTFQQALANLEAVRQAMLDDSMTKLIEIRDNQSEVTTKEQQTEVKKALKEYKRRMADYKAQRVQLTNGIKEVLTEPIHNDQKAVEEDGKILIEAAEKKLKAYDTLIIKLKKEKEEKARIEREEKEKKLTNEFNTWEQKLPRLGVYEESKEVIDYLASSELTEIEAEIDKASKEIQQKMRDALELFHKDAAQKASILTSKEKMVEFWYSIDQMAEAKKDYARGIWETGDRKALPDSFVGVFIANFDATSEKPEGVLQISWDARFARFDSVRTLLAVELKAMYRVFFPEPELPESVERFTQGTPGSAPEFPGTSPVPDSDIRMSRVRGHFPPASHDKEAQPEIPATGVSGQVYEEIELEKGKHEVALKKAELDYLLTNIKDAEVDITDYQLLMSEYPGIVKLNILISQLKKALIKEKGAVPGLKIILEDKVWE